MEVLLGSGTFCQALPVLYQATKVALAQLQGALALDFHAPGTADAACQTSAGGNGTAASTRADEAPREPLRIEVSSAAGQAPPEGDADTEEQGPSTPVQATDAGGGGGTSSYQQLVHALASPGGWVAPAPAAPAAQGRQQQQLQDEWWIGALVEQEGVVCVPSFSSMVVSPVAKLAASSSFRFRPAPAAASGSAAAAKAAAASGGPCARMIKALTKRCSSKVESRQAAAPSAGSGRQQRKLKLPIAARLTSSMRCTLAELATRLGGRRYLRWNDARVEVEWP
jgi:hypothetical protein